MLKAIRGKTKAIIWVVVWGVVIAFTGTIFVTWGMRPSQGQKTNIAAEVNGKKISLLHIYEQLRQQYGKHYEGAKPEEKQFIKNLVLEQMINRILLLKEAKRQKIKVSNEEIIKRIKEYFKTKENKFDKTKFTRAVKNISSQQWQIWEESTKESLMMEKLRRKIVEGVKVTDKEGENYYIKNNEEAKIKYILIDPKTFVPSEKIKAYYEKNKEEFRIVKEDKSYLQPFKEVKEKIKGKIVSVEEEEKAKEKAEKIYQEIKTEGKGALKFKETDFFKRGGFIPKLGWAPEIAKVSFNLKKGEYSEVLKTQQGYCIIQLIEKKDGDLKKFAEEKRKIMERLKQEKQAQLYNEWFNQIKTQARIKRFTTS